MILFLVGMFCFSLLAAADGNRRDLDPVNRSLNATAVMNEALARASARRRDLINAWFDGFGSGEGSISFSPAIRDLASADNHVLNVVNDRDGRGHYEPRTVQGHVFAARVKDQQPALYLLSPPGSLYTIKIFEGQLKIVAKPSFGDVKAFAHVLSEGKARPVPRSRLPVPTTGPPPVVTHVPVDVPSLGYEPVAASPVSEPAPVPPSTEQELLEHTREQRAALMRQNIDNFFDHYQPTTDTPPGVALDDVAQQIDLQQIVHNVAHPPDVVHPPVSPVLPASEEQPQSSLRTVEVALPKKPAQENAVVPQQKGSLSATQASWLAGLISASAVTGGYTINRLWHLYKHRQAMGRMQRSPQWRKELNTILTHAGVAGTAAIVSTIGAWLLWQKRNGGMVV